MGSGFGLQAINMIVYQTKRDVTTFHKRSTSNTSEFVYICFISFDLTICFLLANLYLADVNSRLPSYEDEFCIIKSISQKLTDKYAVLCPRHSAALLKCLSVTKGKSNLMYFHSEKLIDVSKPWELGLV